MLRAFAGGTVFGEPLGDGPLRVLALHGWRRSHDDFREPLSGLPALAADLPGFGASPPPPDPWATADYARALGPVLEELAASAGRAVVVGHSFGGRVAVHLAAQQPEAVAALVVTGVPLVRLPGAGHSRPPWPFRAGRSLHRLGLVGDGRMERLRQRYGSADYRAAAGVMRGVLVRAVNETYEQPLRAIRCPVELVWGEADTAAPPAVAHAAAALLADARVTVLAGVGHLTPIEAPGALRHAVERAMAVAR